MNADREQAMDRWIEAVAETQRRKVAADQACALHRQAAEVALEAERDLVALLGERAGERYGVVLAALEEFDQS